MWITVPCTAMVSQRAFSTVRQRRCYTESTGDLAGGEDDEGHVTYSVLVTGGHSEHAVGWRHLAGELESCSTLLVSVLAQELLQQ